MSGSARRSRGQIETLPSGSLRVKVYAGTDPISGKRLYLDETIPAGPRAAKEAEKARTRLQAEVDQRRNPRTRATVGQTLDRHLSMLDVEPTTRVSYEGYVRNHIRPVLGDLSLGRLETDTVESFYSQLRTCSARCGGRHFIEHRTTHDHECDARCRPHECRPMAASTVRQIHWILKSACDSAIRWKWISVNPAAAARKPNQKAPDPQPPSTEQAARISAAAWRDPDWGMLVWLAMMTGARRGELCALRWNRLDFSTGVLTIRASIAQADGRSWEKDTKAHQQRRVSLDPPTLELLRLYQERREAQVASVGVELPEGALLFSRDPAGSTWLQPDSVSQRYAKMCRRLGWDMNIHQLRHYSATELIAAGVDLRTVAGRLGHSGGGVTTLRTYAAFQPEADGRAATMLGSRLPRPPALAGASATPLLVPEVPEDASPYQRIAADLFGAITCGALAPGDPVPAIKVLAKKYSVAFSTAQRAVASLAANGHVTLRPGRRSVVAHADRTASQ